MSFFNNFKIKTKISFLAIALILGILFFSIIGIIQKLEFSKEMDSALKLTDFASKVSNLVHELQKERGMTAGYLGSEGEDFSAELSSQRVIENKKQDDLNSFLAEFDKSTINQESQSLLNEVQKQLGNIDDIRKKVDDLGIDAKDAIQYFSELNNCFINVINTLGHQVNDGEIAILLVAYTDFLKGKESAGIERAVVNKLFTSNSFDLKSFSQFSNLVNAQKINFKNVMSLIPPELSTFYENKMQDKQVKEVEALRKIVFSKLDVQKRVGDIKSIIGYGGLIHKFKNYILRKTPKYKTSFIEKYNELEENISMLLEADLLTDLEKEHINTIAAMMLKYRQGIEFTEYYFSQGLNFFNLFILHLILIKGA